MNTLGAGIDFVLPAELAAREPPEARGLARDEVKLMVSRVEANEIINTCFFRFPDYISRGDVIVVNTSATINAALKAGDITLHLSTPLSDDRWVVELRRNSRNGTAPLLDAEAGLMVALPGGASAAPTQRFQVK